MMMRTVEAIIMVTIEKNDDDDYEGYYGDYRRMIITTMKTILMVTIERKKNGDDDNEGYNHGDYRTIMMTTMKAIIMALGRSDLLDVMVWSGRRTGHRQRSQYKWRPQQAATANRLLFYSSRQFLSTPKILTRTHR